MNQLIQIVHRCVSCGNVIEPRRPAYCAGCGWALCPECYPYTRSYCSSDCEDAQEYKEYHE